MIRESRPPLVHNAMTTGRQSGMQTLEHHINELVLANEIDRDVARHICES
jgi:Tfp pilus assembly pilus retraction ATPase PilT